MRDQPVGNVHGGVMYGVGGPELPGLAVVEIHQVDEHAALVGGAQQAFQPREPMRLERTIRPESAHIGTPAGAEAIGVLTIDAVDGLVVSGIDRQNGRSGRPGMRWPPSPSPWRSACPWPAAWAPAPAPSWPPW